MKLMMIGPVGSGKGTQAQVISWRLHYSRYATGDLIRDHIDAGSPLGKEMKGMFDRGEPVPDNIIMRMVVPLLFPGGGFIIDGCPINMTQARAVDKAFEGRHGGPSRVLMLDGLTDDELVERVLSGRLVSKTTNYTYHEIYNPPPSPEEQTDPGPFVRPSHDKEDILRRSLAAYRKEADDLKEHYERRGVLALIDASQPIEKVTEDVFDAIDRPPQQTTE